MCKKTTKHEYVHANANMECPETLFVNGDIDVFDHDFRMLCSLPPKLDV